jgi:hypothetical protein
MITLTYMKKLITFLVVVIVGGVVGYRMKTSGTSTQTVQPTAVTGDYKSTSYSIEGETVVLKNGQYVSEAAPGSVEKITTQFFGNEVKADFNADGKQDVAFILTQDGGGTGIFYYVVAALKTDTGYKGTNGIFLGDRIAPQTTEFKNGMIVVNYADRKPGESFAVDPSIGTSKYLKVNGSTLVEVSR